MSAPPFLIDPALAVRLISVLSWILIGLGLSKIVVFAIGEWMPGAYSKIRSEWFRKLCTGKGNRLLFGLGGLLTALIGFGGLLLGRVFDYLLHLSR